jgi:hypothetical protein
VAAITGTATIPTVPPRPPQEVAVAHRYDARTQGQLIALSPEPLGEGSQTTQRIVGDVQMRKGLMAFVAVFVAMPMFGAIYMQIGPQQPSTAGHVKVFDGRDGSVLLSSARVVQGSCPGAGAIEMELQGTNDALLRAIDAKTPLAPIVVHIDGYDHKVGGGTFKKYDHALGGGSITDGTAPTAGKKPLRVVIRIDYASCEKSQSAPVRRPSTAPACNAKVVGVTPAGPADLCVLRSTTNGTTEASLWLVKGMATQTLSPKIMLMTAQGTHVPVLTIEAKGQKWTFKNVLFSSAQASPDGGFQFSMNFDSMTGDPAAFANISQ